MENIVSVPLSNSPFHSLKRILCSHQKLHPRKKLFAQHPGVSNFIAIIYTNSSGGDQLKLINKIRSEWPKLKVIFIGLSQISNHELILLFRAGLADYFINLASYEEINLSIGRIRSQIPKPKFHPEKFNLTKREYQVCLLLSEGLKNKDIASKLNITPATIKVHKSRIMHKLNINNLADLVRLTSS